MANEYKIHETANEGQPTSTTLAFLRALYGDEAPGWLTISTFDRQPTQWFPAHQLDQAATYCQAIAQRYNVYFGLGLRQAQLADGRGESDDVMAIPGLWVELDLRHAVHKKANLPATIDEALSLVREALPLEPSLVIGSGYGIHVYWIFRELWRFEDADDRQAAYHLLRRLQTTIQGMAKRHGWEVDSTFDLARVLRLPGTFNRKVADDPRPVEGVESSQGQCYNPSDFDAHLVEVDEARYQQATNDDHAGDLPPIELHALRLSGRLKTLILFATDVDREQPYPTRSEALFDALKWLLKVGIDDVTIMRLALDPRHAISEKPLEKGRKWLAGELARARAWNERHAARNGDEMETPRLTDVGNGLRLVQQFGQDLRYVTTWKKWLLWHDGRWAIDGAGSVEWHAKQVIASLYRTARQDIARLEKGVPGDEDEAARKRREKQLDQAMRTAKWAHTSESGTHIELMVRRARANPAVQVDHDALDANPMLFQVMNGTLDLTTGTLRAPRQGDLITRRSPALYDPNAIAPLWTAFLQRVQGYPQPNETLALDVRDHRIWDADEMITYLKRLVGMSLTGDVSAQILLFLHGTGQNGKSRFLNTIRALMGEYGMQAAPNFLLVREHEQHPTEQADLFGKRFVSTIEVEKGKHLAEALMKVLTGEERVRARRMREDFWEFPPTWKVWFCANDKPKVKGRDKATWRRIKLIPFDVTIPDAEVDPDLGNKLLQELPGILNWAIEGCLEWQAHGLQEPAKVTRATEAYREETDLLAQFFKECCTLNADLKTQSSLLLEAFIKYTGQTVSPVEFADIMTAGGYQKKTIHGRMFWAGVGLNATGTESDGRSHASR